MNFKSTGKFQFVLIAIILFISSSSLYSGNPEVRAPKYIFLFIGDGMGLAQTSLAEVYQASVQGKIGMGKLSFNTFPAHGLISTYAEDRLITCSAAAGTALSAGKKTTINTIGLDGSRTDSLKGIMQLAMERGMKTGIISTQGLNHATPAAFYAHVPNRDLYYEIAGQIPGSRINFFGGGGIMEPKGKSGDLPDIWNVITKSGYKKIDSRKEFLKLKRGDDKIFITNPNLDEEWAMPYSLDYGENDFSFSEIVGKAIDLLENPNGFFIMAEAGKIDWACHRNDAAGAIGEILELDKAVRKALDFYLKYPEETLIIVTADHETGGLGLGHTNMRYKSNLQILSYQTQSLAKLTGKTKLFLDNPDTVNGFVRALNFLDQELSLGSKIILNGADSLQLKQAYNAALKNKMPFIHEQDNYLMFGIENPLAVTAVKILARKAGIGWTTWSHTAIPVPVRAIGPGRELFESYIDNTDIPNNIAKLLKGKLN